MRSAEDHTVARILLIEDDDAVRRMLLLTLQRQGHEVVQARDGNEGITLQKDDPADVVLTDVIMPERDGLEAIMEMRRRNRDVRIVAMSGGGRVCAADYLEIAHRMGVVATLRKPFSDAELSAAISAALLR